MQENSYQWIIWRKIKGVQWEQNLYYPTDKVLLYVTALCVLSSSPAHYLSAVRVAILLEVNHIIIHIENRACFSAVYSPMMTSMPSSTSTAEWSTLLPFSFSFSFVENSRFPITPLQWSRVHRIDFLREKTTSKFLLPSNGSLWQPFCSTAHHPPKFQRSPQAQKCWGLLSHGIDWGASPSGSFVAFYNIFWQDKWIVVSLLVFSLAKRKKYLLSLDFSAINLFLLCTF